MICRQFLVKLLCILVVFYLFKVPLFTVVYLLYYSFCLLPSAWPEDAY